jgi:hypothetical protein
MFPFGAKTKNKLIWISATSIEKDMFPFGAKTKNKLIWMDMLPFVANSDIYCLKNIGYDACRSK